MPPAYGLPTPGSSALRPGGAGTSATPPAQTAQSFNVGGLLSVGNQAAALAMDAPPPSLVHQVTPVVMALAGHVRTCFSAAKEARRDVEQRMLAALRARRGEYSAEKLAQIAAQRQPAIYMMVAASKMRQVESLLRDVLIGRGTEKPFTTTPTPDPELPPSFIQAAIEQLQAEIEEVMASGFMPSIDAARQRMRELRDELTPIVMEEARKRCARMETKMEDQLVEGGYLDALDAFITDLATFPTAFIAGPIIRRKPQLLWDDEDNLIVEDKLVPEWERVDPFDVFPAKWAVTLDSAPVVRLHRLTRLSLTEMIGVEGFDEAAIRKVLDEHPDGFSESSQTDAEKAVAEGRTPGSTSNTGLLDTLQYWGTASGKMLRDWGIPKAQCPDVAKEYQVEVWMVNTTVIKAMLNADPLGRRPLYGCSFQKVPGTVWGNAPYDLMTDCEGMCNAAARSLAANLGISSGPQVAVLSDRIPAGEDVTEMFPWKVWQFESDPAGGSAKPIEFFQPLSNARELLTVFERFSQMADEYTGIPRYMSGFNGGDGGAGRTASGMSMMIGNASKIIKQVLGAVDADIISKMLERLYYHNMRYGTDPALKGDVRFVARGASSLATREAAQIRNNELLTLALNSPVAQEIMGVEGVSELLRGTVKTLDHNPDRIVPPATVVRQRMAQNQHAQMLQAEMMAAEGQNPQQGGPAKKPQGRERLANGAPTTDNFSPQGV